MLGAFAVGKTSLVARFVKGIYSEKYHSTIGVKIDKKVIAHPGGGGERAGEGEVAGGGAGELSLVLWDLEGEDELVRVQMVYLRGAAGYLLVVDGTRPETLETALLLRRRVEAEVGRLPFVLLLNKRDLDPAWALTDDGLLGLREAAAATFETSAKDGRHVEAAFATLAAAALGVNAAVNAAVKAAVKPAVEPASEPDPPAGGGG